jgi:SAM-dependent methyltransferase
MPGAGDGFYDDPVVYEALHASDAPGDVRALRRLARRFGVAKGTASRPLWLEPACGPGRHLRLAARQGIDAIGIDLSSAMIRHARAEWKRDDPNRNSDARARFLVADMADLRGRVRTASVDLAFCLINSIRHLESERAMLTHLHEIRRVLHPRGVYIVGLSVSCYGIESPSEDVWHGRDARTRVRVKQVVLYEPPTRAGDRFERVYSHLVITRQGSAIEEHRDSRYRLFCWNRSQWESVVRRAGLEIVGTFDAEGSPIPPRELGYAMHVLRSRA